MLLSALVVPGCGATLEERTGSGAAIGAGTGAVVGVASGTGIVGGVLVGAAAGGVAGLAVHDQEVAQVHMARSIALRQHMQHQARLWDVAYPILTASAKVCQGRSRPNFGFVAWTRWDIDRGYRIASMSVYGLDDRLRVVHVLPGSPAAVAGMRAGDEIERVGWHDMPIGKTAGAALQLVLQRETSAGVAQTFRVRRGQERHTFEVMPSMQCAVDLIVTDSEQVNAFRYGQSVYMTHGLMRFLPDDDELAAVVAHFVGLALLGHEAGHGEYQAADKLQAQIEQFQLVFLGAEDQRDLKSAGLWPGFRPYSTEQLIQADRAALELMARAGYRLEALRDAWQRIADLDSGPLLLRDFHPVSAERDAAVEDVLNQVRSEGESAGDGAPGS